MEAPLIECELRDLPIDPSTLRRNFLVPPMCGGYVSFEGIIRSSNHGRQVSHLVYDVYPELAIFELRSICERAMADHELVRASVVHRTGTLAIGDIAVMIQVASKHRHESFAGCRQIIDNLKASVPIWKHEYYCDGTDEWTRCTDHQHRSAGPVQHSSHFVSSQEREFS